MPSAPRVARRATQLPADELGRHVVRRAAGRRRVAGVGREAKVAQHGAAFARVQDVGRLDVVVHQIPAVEVAERAGDVAQDARSVLARACEVVRVVGPPHAPRAQVGRVNALHVERQIAGVTAVQSDDALVLQAPRAIRTHAARRRPAVSGCARCRAASPSHRPPSAARASSAP